MKIRDQKSIYFSSLIIGVFSGLFAAGFSEILDYSVQTVEKLFVLRDQKGLFHPFFPEHGFPNSFSFLSFFFLPLVGGLLSGLLIYFFCRDAGGMGTDSMIYSFHHREGKINGLVPFIKSIATILTLSGRGSGGKEGPISLIGAGLGSLFAEFLGAGARARRTLLLAGTAGGLGAIFHAPLGGAITATEMVYKEDVESDALIPCILSSGTAYLVNVYLTGKSRVFELIVPVNYSAREFPFYFLLGVLCYLGGKGFIYLFHKISNQFQSLQIPDYTKPMIGGGIAGFIYLFFPEVNGSGEDWMDLSLRGHSDTMVGILGISYFLTIFLMKILATSFTVGSGGSAGVFGPSLFAGAALGGGVYSLAAMFYPGISSVGFLLVGMGAFYSGVASAPIAGMIMVCEMVGNYELLPPLMLVTIFSVSLGNRMTIYKSQVLNRFSTPAHFWDMNQDIMDKIYLKDISEYIRDLAVFDVKTDWEALQKKAQQIHASDFIISDSGSYVGVLSLRKNGNIHDSSLPLRKYCDTRVVPIPINGTLKSAFHCLLENDIDKVPIIDFDNQVLGYLRISDLFRIYYKHIRK